MATLGQVCLVILVALPCLALLALVVLWANPAYWLDVFDKRKGR